VFKWIRSLFAKPAPNRYQILARGKPVHQTQTYAAAEQFIRDQFDDQSSRAAQLRLFGTTRRQRWAAHRSQFRIDRIRD
jgi:hypothetical protein